MKIVWLDVNRQRLELDGVSLGAGTAIARCQLTPKEAPLVDSAEGIAPLTVVAAADGPLTKSSRSIMVGDQAASVIVPV